MQFAVAPGDKQTDRSDNQTCSMAIARRPIVLAGLLCLAADRLLHGGRLPRCELEALGLEEVISCARMHPSRPAVSPRAFRLPNLSETNKRRLSNFALMRRNSGQVHVGRSEQGRPVGQDVRAGRASDRHCGTEVQSKTAT